MNVDNTYYLNNDSLFENENLEKLRNISLQYNGFNTCHAFKDYYGIEPDLSSDKSRLEGHLLVQDDTNEILTDSLIRTKRIISEIDDYSHETRMYYKKIYNNWGFDISGIEITNSDTIDVFDFMIFEFKSFNDHISSYNPKIHIPYNIILYHSEITKRPNGFILMFDNTLKQKFRTIYHKFSNLFVSYRANKPNDKYFIARIDRPRISLLIDSHLYDDNIKSFYSNDENNTWTQTTMLNDYIKCDNLTDALEKLKKWNNYRKPKNGNEDSNTILMYPYMEWFNFYDILNEGTFMYLVYHKDNCPDNITFTIKRENNEDNLNKNIFKDLINKIKNKPIRESTDEVKNEVKNEIKDEVKNEVKDEPKIDDDYYIVDETDFKDGKQDEIQGETQDEIQDETQEINIQNQNLEKTITYDKETYCKLLNNSDYMVYRIPYYSEQFDYDTRYTESNKKTTNTEHKDYIENYNMIEPTPENIYIQYPNYILYCFGNVLEIKKSYQNIILEQSYN